MDFVSLDVAAGCLFSVVVIVLVWDAYLRLRGRDAGSFARTILVAVPLVAVSLGIGLTRDSLTWLWVAAEMLFIAATVAGIHALLGTRTPDDRPPGPTEQKPQFLPPRV